MIDGRRVQGGGGEKGILCLICSIYCKTRQYQCLKYFISKQYRLVRPEEGLVRVREDSLTLSFIARHLLNHVSLSFPFLIWLDPPAKRGASALFF